MRRAVFVLPLLFVLALFAGCADVLGFQTFTVGSADGGSSVDASLGPVSEAGPLSDAGLDASRPEASAPVLDSGPPVPCSAGCGPGQKCQNLICVCDPLTCNGCCSGTTCSTSWPGCGSGGGACSACDSRTDCCDSNGACACGTGPACALGQSCVAGACTCDATSCSGTCCGDACIMTASDPANCGACGHSCLGATCGGGLCAPTVLATRGTPAWAVALSSTEVYWIAQSGMFACPLAGCGTSPPAGPYDVGKYAFSDQSRVAYLDRGADSLVIASGAQSADPSTIDVFYTELDGGAPTFPVTGAASGWFFDPNSGLYWFDSNQVSRKQVSLAGSQTTIMTGLSSGAAIAVDANNVYVADTMHVIACPLATLNCGTATTLIASTGSPIYLAPEPDSQFIYYADAAAIYRCPYRGCAAPTNVPIWIGTSLLTSLVTDASNVYWADQRNGTIMKCALGEQCAVPTTVASGLDQPQGIAVDGSYVYWTLADANAPAAVERVAK